MTKKLIYVIALVCNIHWLYGTHLVGGDITYRYLGSFSGKDRYEITITMLRDCGNSTVGFDDPLEATLYDATNLLVVDNLTFTYLGDQQVPITSYNPCIVPPENICYAITYYRKTIDLTPNLNGYYIVYERCCRNNTISNLSNPGSQGMTLSCFIPSSTYRNNSPVFGVLPPIYICVGDTFRFPQNATDADGDELVYQLTTPYAGGSQSDPDPSTDDAPPHTFVSFAPGFTTGNMLGNLSAPLSINSQTGELYAVCNQPGQFVFAVSVFEYRNNVLLSEVKRDIQVNVIVCPPNLEPIVQLPSPPQAIGDTLFFPVGTNTCINLTVKDNNPRDSVFAYYSSVIFDNSFSNAMLQADSGKTQAVNRICWQPACEQLFQKYPILTIIRDNYACGNNYDTVTIYAKVIPNNPVSTPNLNCVSVLNNQQIQISFDYTFMDKQDFVYFYKQDDNGNWVLLDSLAAPVTSYTDNNAINANQKSYCYKVAIRYNCNGYVQYSESNVACSILLSHQNIDINTEEITWTSYNPSLGLPVSYDLEGTDANGNPVILASNVSSPYLFQSCSFNGKVRIKVRVNNCTAYSAYSDPFTLYNNPPASFSLCYVTVLDENAGVEIKWSPSADNNLRGYEIWRKDNSNFSKIADVSPSETSYIDNTAQVMTQSYAYYVKAVDNCGETAQTSTYATILLTSYSEPYFIDLFWTNYVNDYPVQEHILYENQNTRNDFIAGNSFNGQTLEHHIPEIERAKGIYCFRVKAKAPGGCGEESYSNSVCVTFPVVLHIPNAFTPNQDGLNDNFSVFGEFIEFYSMKIFDRWGKFITELKSPTETWNGTHNGKACPEDVYVYFLEYKSFDGQSFTKKGSITLLR